MTESDEDTCSVLEKDRLLRTEMTSVPQAQEENTVDFHNDEDNISFNTPESSDGLWDWNLKTGKFYYSSNLKSMLGYSQYELENDMNSWVSMIHPEEKPYVFKHVKSYLSGREKSFEIEIRVRHKDGHNILVRSCALKITHDSNGRPVRIIGTFIEITKLKKSELFHKRNTRILEMIAKGCQALDIYNAIALMYEELNPRMRCSMLELEGDKLLHGGAPSLPKEYCDAIHGLEIGPNSGSCGASTYSGKRVLVEDIETDPKWKNIRSFALSHGVRCCWSEPIKSTSGKVLGSYAMYYDHPALPNEHELNDLVSAARLTGIVMERDYNQKLIRNLAYTDELTGLFNRAHLYLNLKSLIKISARSNHKFSLLYIDLDNFKNVNDSLGHDIGDLHLQEIASRLSTVSCEVDCVARLGGDEFCIIVKDVDETTNVAQLCLDLISKPAVFSGRKFMPTCSIGIATYPDNGKDVQTLLKAADTALYAAKDLGKSRYVFYKKDFTNNLVSRLKIERDLRKAVENQQLSLVYQPQIDIRTGEIIGVEALSRWIHPEFGEIPPSDFIAVAERTGMIKMLTEWVLSTTCSQVVSWRKAGISTVRMSVNISPSHFLDDDLVPLISRIINQTGMLATDLKLEITESVAHTNTKNLSTLKGLKKLGVLLAIDDFGTGYSSFASLKHLNVDYLKIDKYFISDMFNDSKSQLLIGSMIELGHNLGYEIIAEGVETTEQLNMLKKLGCETAQGYLFSEPVSAIEVARLLSGENKFSNYNDQAVY